MAQFSSLVCPYRNSSMMNLEGMVMGDHSGQVYGVVQSTVGLVTLSMTPTQHHDIMPSLLHRRSWSKHILFRQQLPHTHSQQPHPIPHRPSHSSPCGHDPAGQELPEFLQEPAVFCVLPLLCL